MRRLLLLRHAKAEPGGPDQDDHDRVLAERGLTDADAMARYLKAQGYQPDRILCSTSMRTRQTVAPVLREVPAPIEFVEALYHAPPGRIAALAQDADNDIKVLLMVGHNPGLEQCAALLAREPVKPKELHRHDLLEEKFPTGALAVLEFDITSWKKLSPCSGKLVDFVRPRDL